MHLLEGFFAHIKPLFFIAIEHRATTWDFHTSEAAWSPVKLDQPASPQRWTHLRPFCLV